MKKKLLVLISTVLALCTLAISAFAVPTDTGKTTFRYAFYLSADTDGKGVIRARTWVNNPYRVYKHIAEQGHAYDNNRYFIVNNKRQIVNGNYEELGRSYDGAFYSGDWVLDNHRDKTFTKDKSEFLNKYFYQVGNYGGYKPTITSSGNTSVTFDWSGRGYLVHYAYLFAAWCWMDPVTDLRNNNSDASGNALAHSCPLEDFTHAEYRIRPAGGSWPSTWTKTVEVFQVDSQGVPKIENGAYKTNPSSASFPGNPGDTIQIKLVSRMGIESGITEYTFPGAYKVHYNSNFGAAGGTGAMADQTFYVGESKNLSANGFSHNSYTVRFDGNGSTDYPATIGQSSVNAHVSFKHWTKTATDSTTHYTNQQSVKDLSTTNGATVNLYAQWSPGSITLPTATRPMQPPRLCSFFTVEFDSRRVCLVL